MNIIISGTTSGLGKFLYKNIKKAKKFKRNKKKEIKKYNLFVHCGFFKKKNKKITQKQFQKLEKETLNNLYKILSYNCKRIIFISTIEINNKRINKHPYAYLKRKCEKIILKNKKNIVFRVGFLAGKDMRKNTLYKLVNAKSKTKITLSKNSSFYITSYNDVLLAIKKINKNNSIKGGIYNLISSNKFYYNSKHNKNIIYGKYSYNVKNLSNNKFEKNFKFKTKKLKKIILEISTF